ncbi:Lojap-related protein [Actinidia rufa]|uniref:Protein Iojap, chloroplastic n=1 Tax=Actinidia rufa TaxID=165716 RepID=A0A7J0G4Q1_9ERIC|nr:Lojap-related protein [Actinidia rufa]
MPMICTMTCFKKYGKVVFKRKDQKSPSEEANDDAESLSFAVAVAKVANEVKAADIRVLFVKPLVYWSRFFIIATAFSRPQIDAIGSKIRDLAEKQYGKVASGDTKPNSWTLLDFVLLFLMMSVKKLDALLQDVTIVSSQWHGIGNFFIHAHFGITNFSAAITTTLRYNCFNLLCLLKTMLWSSVMEQ